MKNLKIHLKNSLLFSFVAIFLFSCEKTPESDDIFTISPALKEGWSLVSEDKQEKDSAKLKILREAKNGPLTISVTRGSVIDTPGVEAIANAANAEMTGGKAIDGVILKFAHLGEKDGHKGYTKGPIVDQSQAYMTAKGLESVPEGYAFSVKAGNYFDTIGVKYIIQVNGTQVKDNQKEYDSFYNAMLAANEAGATSIGIPGISTGLFGYPKMDAAKLFIKAALSFFNKFPDANLKHIRFIDLDQPMVDDVVSVLDSTLQK